VHDLAPELADWVQTAAAMTALDLVIRVDRGPINFAGALGVPLWVCLAANCHYRWGLEGAQTPWYPSARLFRQPTAGDSASVFAEVAAVLRDLAALEVPERLREDRSCDGRLAYCAASPGDHLRWMKADPESKDVFVRSRELQRRSELVRRESAQLRSDSDMLRRDLAMLRDQIIRARDWGLSLTLGRASRSR
jgi:hypothetical protein